MSTDHSERQDWMAALALTTAGRLRQAWDALAEQPRYSMVRGPETGLVMARARSGNTGERFNLGELTVTRCSVGLPDGTMGHAFIRGASPEHARLAGVFDALMQMPDRREELRRTLVVLLQEERKAHLARRREEVRPSRVDFFTLVRGDD